MRTEIYPGIQPLSLKPNGEGAMASLAYSKTLTAEVSLWFETHLAQRLVVVPMAEQFQIALTALGEKAMRIPIADVGEGLIQVLPVLVAAAMTRDRNVDRARILAIEEPESHLHPRLHAALAQQFCSLVSQDNASQVILETHSENILTEIQIQIASGRLDPSRVVIYWVRTLEDGRGRLEKITFDKLGRPNDGTSLPRGVFAEDMSLKKELLNKQAEMLRQ